MSDQFLVAERPSEPDADTEGTAKLIAGSDDLQRFKSAFIRATKTLMASGDCLAQDFLDEGGLVKAVTGAQWLLPIYFTYCKAGTDRIYLDVRTGRIFRWQGRLGVLLARGRLRPWARQETASDAERAA